MSNFIQGMLLALHFSTLAPCFCSKQSVRCSSTIDFAVTSTDLKPLPPFFEADYRDIREPESDLLVANPSYGRRGGILYLVRRLVDPHGFSASRML